LNIARLLLLLLTFLAVAGEAATLGFMPSDADQVHACVEAEIEKEATTEQQEVWGEVPMVSLLAWGLAWPPPPVFINIWTGYYPHLKHGCGVKHRRHRLLEVDLN
jgi:hypothetical protein